MTRIEMQWPSKELGTITPVSVLLPETKQLSFQQPADTLWLLHGAFGNHLDWTRNTMLEQYLSDRNLAVVMPNGGDSGYNDMAAGGRISRYQSYIAVELRDALPNILPLNKKRENNYVAGLSMGGQGALRLMLSHPEAYSAAAVLSAGNPIHYYGGNNSGSVRLINMFGTDDMAQLKNSPANLIYLAQDFIKQGKYPLPPLFMACGESDPLLEQARLLRDDLLELGFTVEYHEGPGGHDWFFWNKWIVDVLNWLPVNKPQK